MSRSHHVEPSWRSRYWMNLESRSTPLVNPKPNWVPTAIPDSRTLVAGCSNATVTFWAVANGQEGRTLRGHTTQVNPEKAGQIVVGGETYTLTQYHFHAPSEEQIDGKSTVDGAVVLGESNGACDFKGSTLAPDRCGEGKPILSARGSPQAETR